MYKIWFLLLSVVVVMIWCGVCCFFKCIGMLNSVVERKWYDRVLIVKNGFDVEEMERGFFGLIIDLEYLV